MSQPKYYAIIPAAGSSRRMGRPKLLLPWPTADQPQGTVLDQVLGTWSEAGLQAIVVVCRPGDRQLAAHCQRWHVDVVQPTQAPVDMKASVQVGLEHVRQCYQPHDRDACFVAPADLPRLPLEVIAGLSLAYQRVANATAAPMLHVPTFAGKPGHPLLLPWAATPSVFQLRPDEGLDRLLHEPSLRREVVFESSLAASDMDTPGDYQRELGQQRSAP